jgi:hypothetical protein
MTTPFGYSNYTVMSDYRKKLPQSPVSGGIVKVASCKTPYRMRSANDELAVILAGESDEQQRAF